MAPEQEADGRDHVTGWELRNLRADRDETAARLAHALEDVARLRKENEELATRLNEEKKLTAAFVANVDAAIALFRASGRVP